MSKRRKLVGLAVLVAGVLVVLILMRLRNSGTGSRSGQVVTDVAVHVGQITRATFHRFVTAYGRVEPEPAGGGKPPAAALISPFVSGIIVEIDCLEGRQVSRGTILFRLDSRVAKVSLLKAQRALEFAEKTYERQKELLKAHGTSQKAFQEAESQLDAARNELSSAKTQLALLQIGAPLSGTLVRLNATLGQSVEPNMVLAEIIDLSRLVVAASVPSQEASLLGSGQPVRLGSSGSAAGSLIFIGKDIDPKTDTIPIRASIPAGTGFQPGQFLDIQIVCEEKRGCLAVPEESLVTKAEEGSWIMLVQGETAIRKPVTNGLREGGLVEVEGEGLKEGMIIVTEDAYSLPEKTKIRIISR
jgi:membrane fusion protein (multidrug efflux system)